MGQNTSIQWCDDTVNPTMGCDGCELWRTGVTKCYAGKLHRRLGGRKGYAPTFAEVTKFPGRTAEAARRRNLSRKRRLNKPWLSYCPRLLFVSDMSDVLSAAIDFDYARREIVDVACSPHGSEHRWLWLTKRPGRMAAFSAWLAGQGIAWPQNLWAGTSVTTQATVSRLDELARVGDETTRRFASVEPQWGAITLGAQLEHLHWVIQGGESGTGTVPFNTDWAKSLREECEQARVAYFLKQLGKKVIHNGEPLTLADGHGGEWDEWPAELRTRQMPDFAIRSAAFPETT